ncbi:HlyD family secretion protein [Halioxenophilus sp. WMMB6]|uniref:HlyD family secretion protein n=1 Tax=Halioxenophilus sp. WMMB6 TaxID=3073815 RepID=UPI00295EAD12|nr:HlyD family secretion protein [Halioxenophilus sp. WMMB6]
MSQSMRRLTIMLVGPLVLIIGVTAYYLSTANSVNTDNAYIQQSKVSISAEVGGRIVEVAVEENQQVQAGDLLFRIDPEPYQLAVLEAEASVARAKAKLVQLQTALETSDVDIESALEDVAYFEKEYHRQLELVKTSVTTQAAVQAAEHALSEARSRLASARADADKAQAALSTGGFAADINPEVRAAEVQLQQAKLNLSRTEVYAPVTGIVAQTDRLHIGQMMMQALPAVTIVKNDSSWVEANFKETDLEKLRVGQPVTIEIDSYPELPLAGHVLSIGAGTGSEFSLLPAQNANANWVKVTQRVPVRIAIHDQPELPLIAGLSVHVRVDISR